MEKILYDLTNPQKSIWVTEQFYQNSSVNNIVGHMKIAKNADLDALEKALNLFIMNNDAFKLKVVMENNKPKQYFSDFIYQKFERIDIENELQLDEFEKKFSQRNMCTENSLLFNIVILRLPNSGGMFIINAHHLISDAWTMSLLLNEVYTNYLNIIEKKEIEPIHNPSYLDFIKSNTDYLNSEKFQKDKEYWDENFKDFPSIVTFKETSPSISSNRKVFNFSESLIEKIEDFCTQNKVSVYIFLLAIYGVYFRNIFNTNRFVIGNPVLNRSGFKEKHTVRYVCIYYALFIQY